MAFLDVRDVHKTFATPRGATHVLGGASLALEDGEFVAIVGYSGSGKTTFISLLAGLLPPDCGEIHLDGVPVKGPGPERGIVFQQYSLLPWMTVFDNVALAVDAVDAGRPAAARRMRTDELIALVNLTAAAGKRPRELSGGMRQRVAFLRTLMAGKPVLLLDEPFGGLDAITRGEMQEWLAGALVAEPRAVILVTHDVEEALYLSDRVAVLSARPAQLVAELAVPGARARPRAEAITTPEFARRRQHALAALKQGSVSASLSKGGGRGS